MKSDRKKLLDRKKMERAFALLMEGIGLDIKSPRIKRIPARVAEAWRTELLDGYSMDPAEILSRTEQDSGGKLVMVKGIRFTSMCPHHLLPYSGEAHVCYVPGKRIVGLNRIVMLVDCFTHRLELQERATTLIAGSLMRYLGARGAACLMESEHTCMTKRGVKREGARVITTSFMGELERDPHLKRILLSSINKQ